MCPQTEAHKTIKEIVLKKLRETYGSGLTEYPDSGNIIDICIIAFANTKIFVEVIWKGNFEHDLNILHNSDAQIKIVIVNPQILGNKKLIRGFQKTQMSEKKRGVQISDMIDGQKILESPQFRDEEFPRIVKELVESSAPIMVNPSVITLTGGGWISHSIFKVFNKADQPYYQINIELTTENPAVPLDKILIEPEKPNEFSTTTIGVLKISGLFGVTIINEQGHPHRSLILPSIDPKQTITFKLTDNFSKSKTNVLLEVKSFSKEPTKAISRRIKIKRDAAGNIIFPEKF